MAKPWVSTPDLAFSLGESSSYTMHSDIAPKLCRRPNQGFDNLGVRTWNFHRADGRSGSWIWKVAALGFSDCFWSFMKDPFPLRSHFVFKDSCLNTMIVMDSWDTTPQMWTRWTLCAWRLVSTKTLPQIPCRGPEYHQPQARKALLEVASKWAHRFHEWGASE